MAAAAATRNPTYLDLLELPGQVALLSEAVAAERAARLRLERDIKDVHHGAVAAIVQTR